MKTDIFNFNRLGLMFQRYFIERSRTELIYWIIMVIVFMFIRNVAPLMAGLIIIAGVFYASRFFREIHSSGSGVAYFMIPATQLEKLTVGIVLTSFYYFAMMMVAYIIGNLLGTLLNNMLASININMYFWLNLFHYSPLQWKLWGIAIEPGVIKTEHTNFLFYLFKIFLIGQSIYLLGSIYFKRNQFLATFLSTSIIQILLFILFATILILVAGSVMVDRIGNYEWGQAVGEIAKIFFWLLPPFFWIVSYFRLTEKQV